MYFAHTYLVVVKQRITRLHEDFDFDSSLIKLEYVVLFIVKNQQEFVKVDVQHPIQTRRSSQASTRRTMYQYQSASISMPSRQVLFVYSPHDSPAEVFVTVITHSHSPADSSKQVPLRRTDCFIRGGIPQNITVLVPPTRGLPSPMTRPR